VKRVDDQLKANARDVETIARAIALADVLDALGVAGANDVKVWWLDLQDAITPTMRRG
jgi:hypothetical protein